MKAIPLLVLYITVSFVSKSYSQNFDKCKLQYSGFTNILSNSKNDSLGLDSFKILLDQDFQKIRNKELLITQNKFLVKIFKSSESIKFETLSQKNRGILPVEFHVFDSLLFFECKTLINYQNGIAKWSANTEFFLIEETTDFDVYEIHCWQLQNNNRRDLEEKKKKVSTNSSIQPRTDSTYGKTPAKTKKTNQRRYITGPKGGCYYINSQGSKVYVDRSYCN